MPSNIYILSSSGELYHYGIKGQKWGVRRYQNKDGSLTPAGKRRVSNKELKQERSDLRKKYYKSEATEDNAKLESLYDEMYELASKYDFDQDDGGGGTTPASRKAGQRYMELNDEIMDLENDIDYRVNKKATDMLIAKYGKERVDRFETQENIAIAMKVTAYLLGVPIGIGALIGLASSR